MRAGLVVEYGVRIERVAPCARPPRDFAPHEIIDGLLTPALLNAHAHLNYSGATGLPRGSFAEWLSAIIALRRSGGAAGGEEGVAATAAAGAAALRADGVGEVWDIASMPEGLAALRASGLAGISFYEVIHPRADGVGERLDLLRTRWAAHRAACGAGVVAGLAPHAPYSVAPAMAAGVAELARAEGAPLAVHLAESPEELELLTQHAGPLLEVLRGAGGDPRAYVPRGVRPIAWAEAAGLLGPATLAIHANLPSDAEVALLAARRCVVVCCPRSHAWFGYPAYPLAAYRAAGVRLALGTDSRASNERLSIRAELRELMRWPAAATWRPRELLGLATGAALGAEPPFGGRGRLAVGAPARLATWRLSAPPRGEADALEQMLDGER